jgi:alpha-tubulin suppressor-like RCC1 family protein
VHELTPVTALDTKGIVQVAAGEFHCIALDVYGSCVFTWGRADSGQLGIGPHDGECVASPELVYFSDQIENGKNVQPTLVAINAGGTHSMAVSIDNELWTWGSHVVGANGHPGNKDVLRPRMLDIGSLIPNALKTTAETLQAAGGTLHSIALVKRTET